MSTRNLDALFAPRSIVLVGANSRPGSVGQVLSRNLLGGGFAGPITLVDPQAGTVEGVAVHARIADLPEPPDLAVIATPAAAAPQVIAELGERGARAAVVISAGFETAGTGARLRQAILEAARPHRLRIIGPNCLGLLSPGLGINASFSRAMPPAGRVALVAQSGAVAAAAMDWAPLHGLGFSHVVTVGDCADIDVADILGHLATDSDTQGVLLYLEGVKDGRKFIDAAQTAAAAKPVAVLKAGRGAPGARAALSHTGALAGAYAAYQAAFQRAGLLEATSLGELMQAGVTFGALENCGPRLAILTNGGGAGVLTADALERLGEGLAELSPETLAVLNALAPANWSRGNPVDILGDARPALYRAAMKALLAAPEVDALLVLNCPTAVAEGETAAQAVIEAIGPARHKPVLTAWLGGETAAAARRRFAAAAVPTYEGPEDVALAAHWLAARRRTPARTRPAPDNDRTPAAARAIARRALAEGRRLLTDPEARALLSACGVPVVESRQAATPAEAASAAEQFGGRVVLKILSQDINHKSDIGGVRIGLAGGAQTAEAATTMLAVVSAARPDARIEGFIVEPMIARPEAQEILAGVARDPTFGPLVMVGQGGIAVEVLADRALGLPPLDDELAREMIARTRVSRLLAGFRNRPAADLTGLSACLVALGRLVTDVPEIDELDINPLLCDAAGVLALDARIALRPADPR